MHIIREEAPDYFTLVIRKSFTRKMIESVVFLVAVFFLGINFGYPNTIFTVGVVGGFVLILGLSPIIYRAMVKPLYTLTEQEVIIRKFDKETKVSLRKVKKAYDLRYMFMIEDKKVVLSVSDAFINDLEKQLERINKR